jgi:hypothetical protein
MGKKEKENGSDQESRTEVTIFSFLLIKVMNDS